MPYEVTYGLLVSDQETYARYRKEMAPMLEDAGGRFRYDFEVARTLKSEAGGELNRVFVIQFPDRKAWNGFLADPRYAVVRARYFEPSVARMVKLSESGPPE